MREVTIWLSGVHAANLFLYNWYHSHYILSMNLFLVLFWYTTCSFSHLRLPGIFPCSIKDHSSTIYLFEVHSLYWKNTLATQSRSIIVPQISLICDSNPRRSWLEQRWSDSRSYTSLAKTLCPTRKRRAKGTKSILFLELELETQVCLVWEMGELLG